MKMSALVGRDYAAPLYEIAHNVIPSKRKLSFERESPDA